jgi:preprotein translocase subunit SecA
MTKIDKSLETELEAAAFRRLVTHLRERTDVQNIDLMNLAGFCRNCLANWYQEAANARGLDLTKDGAREVIYGMRRQILDGESQEETIREWMEELLDGIVDLYLGADVHPEDWDLAGLGEALHRQFDVKLPPAVASREVASRDAAREALRETVQERYAGRDAELGSEVLRQLERWVMLQIIDGQWKDHLLSMDHLKEGIGLRGYGQRDPLTEYKREAFDIFQEMVDRVGARGRLYKVQIAGMRRWAPRERRADAPRGGVPLRPRRRRGRPRPRGRRPGRRSGATTRARAARARSTRSAAT